MNTELGLIKESMLNVTGELSDFVFNNGDAGTRVRKAMQDLMVLASDIRKKKPSVKIANR